MRFDWGKLASEAVLALMFLAYMTVFCCIVFSEQNAFWYGNFDLGIIDQGIWLISRFEPPFMTTRGLHIFGDHAGFINLLVAPVFWVWDDTKALLVAHTFAFASGVVPVYLIARRRFESSWVPLVFSFAYILFPAIHFGNLDSGYHAESWTVPLILFSYLFLVQGRLRLYFASVFLALTCKEDVFAAIFLFGLYVAIKHNLRVGLASSVMALAYMLVVTGVLMPYFNDRGAFYVSRTFGSFGDTPIEMLSSATNASFMAGRLDNGVNREYVRGLFAPTGYLVVLEPLAVASSATLWVNLLQDWGYAHDIRYHYSTPIIPFIFIALIEGLFRFRKRRLVLAVILAYLAVSSVYSNYYYGPDQSSLRNVGRIVDTIRTCDEVPFMQAQVRSMIGTIPEDASVSSTYNLIPQMSHRRRVYMFPNPFRVSLFGIDDGGIPQDNYTDYVILDRVLVYDEEDRFQTASRLVGEWNYTLVGSAGTVDLYRRHLR
ncbi:MAG: DUF2079 domain-containing protein [Candidatus Altiarchaeota archaeon]